MSGLIDGYGREIEYLRLSVTDRCNFRCFYCIPKGVNRFTAVDKLITTEEHIRLVRLFGELGVTKVRLTGGEPLVYRGITGLIEGISELPEITDLSMSTNASQLESHAAMLGRAGISRINVSLDSLNPDVFKKITQSKLGPVMAGLMAAKRAGLNPIKINMVVMRDINLNEVSAMVDFCIENSFTLRFIEAMPVGAGGQAAQQHYVPLDEVKQILEKRFSLEPSIMFGAGPARYYRIGDSDINIGFITPVSQHFCDTCNRVRLSSEGTLYLCLGQQDTLELRPLLRKGLSDDEIKQQIRTAIDRKPMRHDFNTRPEQVVRFMSMTGG